MAEPYPIRETRFTLDTSAIKFGPGATHEVGADVARLGGRRVLVITDPRLAAGRPSQRCSTRCGGRESTSSSTTGCASSRRTRVSWRPPPSPWTGGSIPSSQSAAAA